MLGRRRTKVLAAGASLLSLGAAAAFGSSSAAQGSGRPAISGDPVVGSTLTASASPTGQTLYQWQGCDPDIANCADSLVHTDPNWFDLTGQSHAASSYTVTPADAGNFIRVLVHDNNTGDKWATSVPVGPVPEPPAPPAQPGVTAQGQTIAPEHGISLLVQPTGGNVLIKLPGASGFGPLNGLQKIPVESVLDTRGGKVRVTAATGNLGDTTEDKSVEFYDGLIRLQQAGDPNAPTVAKLIQKLRCGKQAKGAKASAASGPVAATSRARHRRVWGSGSGSYGSRGSGGTGSVRGTTWLTKDTCKGTFFKVTEGIGISVFDFDLGKTRELGPGQSYFAKNR
jgi:hypothetical protein